MTGKRPEWAMSDSLSAVCLVGVIAIGVASAGVYVWTQPAQMQPPAVNAIIESDEGTVTIQHAGGETLDRMDMKITVNGIDQTEKFVDQNGNADWQTFSNGDTLYYTGADTEGGVQMLYTGGATGASTSYMIATDFKSAGNTGNLTPATTQTTATPTESPTEVTPTATVTPNTTTPVPTETVTPTPTILPPDTFGAYADPGCIWPYRWHHWDYWDHGRWDNVDYWNHGCYKYYENFGNTAYYGDNGYWDEGYHPYNKFVRITIRNVTAPSGEPVTIRITRVTQDEPVDNNGDGFHTKQPDAFIAGSVVYVRAESNPYGDGRVYRISFEATDSQGRKSAGSVDVRVLHDWSDHGTCAHVKDSGQFYDSTLSGSQPIPISASFTSNVTSGDAPLTVQFVDTSTGSTIAGWSWSFGDGTYSSVQNPVHTYTGPGTYRVSLTASGPFDSDTVTSPGYITVSQGPVPTPTASGETPVAAEHLYLSAAKGSYLKSGTYIQFMTANGASSMILDGQQYSFKNNHIVRITMNGDQSPAASTLYVSGSTISGLSGIKAYIKVTDAEGNPDASYSGTLTGITIVKYDSYASTLTLVVPSFSSSTIFYADWSPVISSPDDNQEIQIFNLSPDSTWGLALAFNPGSTALSYGSGSYLVG